MSNWLFSLMVVIVCSLAGCSTSPLRMNETASHNQSKMKGLRKGMTGQQVHYQMGKPYKQETKIINGQTYNIWFYITRGTALIQTQLVAQNFTPIVLRDGVVIGWGNQFYERILKMQYSDDSRPRSPGYTHDEEEWPSDGHRYVPAPGGEKELSPYHSDESQDEQNYQNDMDSTDESEYQPIPSKPQMPKQGSANQPSKSDKKSKGSSPCDDACKESQNKIWWD